MGLEPKVTEFFLLVFFLIKSMPHINIALLILKKKRLLKNLGLSLMI